MATESSKPALSGEDLSSQPGVTYDGVKSSSEKLHRCLGVYDVIFFGVGKMVGAGILVLIGQAAREAGPAVCISYLVTGLAVLCTALCYADFVSRVPLAGSAYSFVRASLGDFPMLAFGTGWVLVFEYSCGAACLARGWTGYLHQFLLAFELKKVPAWLRGVPLSASFELDLLAALLLCLALAIVASGISNASGSVKLLTCAKLACVVLVIVVASLHANTENWTSGFAPNGISGVSSAGLVVFYSYIGFDAAASIAEEVKEPEKNMPIGLLASLAITATLYVLVCVSVTLMVPATSMDTRAPLAVAFQKVGITWMNGVVSIAAVLGLPAGIMMNLTSVARTLMTISRDGMLPKFASLVHPASQTPLVAHAITGMFALLLTLVVPFEVLLVLVSCGTLAALIIVNTGFICRRYIDNNLPLPWAQLATYMTSLSFSVVILQSMSQGHFGFATGAFLAGCGLVPACACFFTLLWHCPPAIVSHAQGFRLPGGALAPLLGTMTCITMFFQNAPERVLWPILLWLVAGLLVYFAHARCQRGSPLESTSLLPSSTAVA